MITRDKTQIDTPRSYSLTAPVYTASISVKTHTDKITDYVVFATYIFIGTYVCKLDGNYVA